MAKTETVDTKESDSFYSFSRYTEADTKEANFEDWLYDCPILEKDCTDEWVEKDKMGNDVKVVCYYFKIPKESKND